MTSKEANLSTGYEEDGDLNFEAFSERPEYKKVNEDLMRRLISRLPAFFRHVDVATGTGLVPQLMKEALPEGRKGIIFGIDPNRTSLDIAERNVSSSRDVQVEFIEGLGQNLEELLRGKIPEEGVDGVSILDAIHEIREDGDKAAVIKAMVKILEPGGFFAFNSAFTTEGISQDPMSWGKLKLWAMADLGVKKRNKLVKGLPILKPEEYRQMIENAGLKIIHEKRKIVNLTIASLKAISRYPAFIEGVFEDMLGQERFTVREKSDALIQAIEKLAVPTLPRVWFEMLAQKPLA